MYEVEVEIKNPLDFRNLSDTDIDNILQLDMDGLLTKDMVKQLSSNHQLLKTSLDLRAERLKALGYDGLIANTGKAGHNSTEYAVVSSKQAKITKSVTDTAFDTIVEVEKFNPYHDAKGRFTTAGTATSFTHRTKDPNKQHLADRAKDREKQRTSSDGEDESPRMKTIHSIEDKIRNQNYESSAVVDKDGNVVLTKDGNKNSVSYTRLEAALMQGNTLTHNHPRSSMFSDEDIQFFSKNKLDEIRATNREGITYSIRRGEGYTNADGTVFALEYSINSGLARQAAQRDLDNRGFQRKVARGEITPEQANIEFGKVVNRELANFCEKKAPEYNLVFSIDKRDISKSAAAPYADIAKSADAGDGEFVLDRETEEKNDAAFNEWLQRAQSGAEDPAEKSFSVFKTDDDKRLVFGWASVSITVDGEQVEDRQQDIIDPEDLEAAAYEYVLNFRDSGEEHIPTLRKKGKLVESCVFTEEKQKAMGIPAGVLPIGWWIGFKIEDDAAWEKVKNGTYKMFSIEGKAQREPVQKSVHDVHRVAKTFDQILEINKFNPYHDSKGRFATAQGYSSFTTRTKDPGKQHMANRAIAREKERNAAAGSKDEGKAKITAAEDKIRGMLKDGATVKLEGVDPEMADSIAASIETVLKRYPSTKDAFEGFTTDDTDKGSFKEENGVMGCFVPRTGMIHLNASYYGDKAAFEKKFQDGVDKQFHPKGLTADSVVVHEMGHAIDTYVSKKCIPAMDYNWGGERVSSRIWNNAIKNGKKNNEPVTGKSIREGLSGYAGKNHSEYLAEGFAEFVMSRNPRPLATKIGKDLERYIKKAEKA